MTAISNGGAAQRVKVLTDADLKANGGQYYLEGRPPVAVYGVTDAETVTQGGQFVVMGNVAQPVYVVDAPDGVIEATIAPIPMIAVEGGLALGGSAILVYVVGGSLGGGLDPVGNLTLEITGADFDVITASWGAVTGATEYDVEYSPDGVTYTPVDTTPLLAYDITDSDYDVDVAIHYVRVRASNGSVDSDWTVVQISGLLINLVAYWRLNANGNDSVGSNNLTANGTITYGSGVLGDAAYFDSANSEYFSLASVPAVEMGDINFAIACWANLDSANLAGVVSKHTEWALFNLGGSPLFYIVDTGNAERDILVPVVGEEFRHFICYHDATNSQINLSVNNGSLATTNLSTTIASPTTEIFAIGRRSTQYLEGAVQHVGIWKGRLLSATQRSALYNGGVGFDPTA